MDKPILKYHHFATVAKKRCKKKRRYSIATKIPGYHGTICVFPTSEEIKDNWPCHIYPSRRRNKDRGSQRIKIITKKLENLTISQNTDKVNDAVFDLFNLPEVVLRHVGSYLNTAELIQFLKAFPDRTDVFGDLNHHYKVNKVNKKRWHQILRVHRCTGVDLQRQLFIETNAYSDLHGIIPLTSEICTASAEDLLFAVQGELEPSSLFYTPFLFLYDYYPEEQNISNLYELWRMFLEVVMKTEDESLRDKTLIIAPQIRLIQDLPWLTSLSRQASKKLKNLVLILDARCMQIKDPLIAPYRVYLQVLHLTNQCIFQPQFEEVPVPFKRKDTQFKLKCPFPGTCYRRTKGIYRSNVPKFWDASEEVPKQPLVECSCLSPVVVINEDSVKMISPSQREWVVTAE